MDKGISRVISLSRFPLAFLIVLLHSAIFFETLLAQKLVRLFSATLCDIVVPVFFFISGYLFYNYDIDKYTNKKYIKKLCTRIKSLLIPYIIWNLIFIFNSWGSSYWNYKFHGIKTSSLTDKGLLNVFYCWSSGSDFSNVFGFAVPMAFPVDGVLWFVRDLIILAMIYPIIHFFIKGIYLRGIICCIIFLLYYFNIWFPNAFLSITGLFFFLGGSVIRYMRIDFLKLFMKYKIFIISLFILITLFSVLECNTPFYNFYIRRLFLILGIPIVFLLFNQKLYARIETFLLQYSSISFFIYAAQGLLFIGLFSNFLFAIFKYLLPLSAAESLFYLVSPFFKVFILLLIYRILKYFFPFFAKILNGYR